MNSIDNHGFDSAASDAMRAAMVASQLRPNAVTDPRVLAAMLRIRREDFVPAASRGIAYRDTPLPLGEARYLNPPIATGRLLTAAALRPTDRVLLIGAATGYTAAVLSEVVASVIAVEQDPALIATARELLAGLGNVTIVEGPLGEGHAEGGPYDVLIVDGAVETMSDALVDQIAPGGRVAAGIAERGVTRLADGRRTEGGFGLSPFVDSECVILPEFARPVPFRF